MTWTCPPQWKSGPGSPRPPEVGGEGERSDTNGAGFLFSLVFCSRCASRSARLISSHALHLVSSPPSLPPSSDVSDRVSDTSRSMTPRPGPPGRGGRRSARGGDPRPRPTTLSSCPPVFRTPSVSAAFVTLFRVRDSSFPSAPPVPDLATLWLSAPHSAPSSVLVVAAATATAAAAGGGRRRRCRRRDGSFSHFLLL